MTDAQKRFCDEYLIDCNATQAAIRAGYSPKTAVDIGHENLNKPKLKKYIDDRLEQLQSERIASTQEVLEYTQSQPIYNHYHGFYKNTELDKPHDILPGSIPKSV